MKGLLQAIRFDINATHGKAKVFCKEVKRLIAIRVEKDFVRRVEFAAESAG